MRSPPDRGLAVKQGAHAKQVETTMKRNPWMFGSNLFVFSFLLTSSALGQGDSGSPSVVDAFPRQALACQNAGPQTDGQAGQTGGSGGQGGQTGGQGGPTGGRYSGVRQIRGQQTEDQKVALADLCNAAGDAWDQCIQEGDCQFLGIIMAWIDISAQCQAKNGAACAVDDQASKAYSECTGGEDQACNELATVLIQANSCGTSAKSTPQK
jgi:hypothetical protein